MIDKWEMRALEQRLIMMIIGLGLAIIGFVFDLGTWSPVLISFGLTTVVLNLALNIYKMSKV